MNVCGQLEPVEYYLPERELDNGALSAQFPNWQVEKIAPKRKCRATWPTKRTTACILQNRRGATVVRLPKFEGGS